MMPVIVFPPFVCREAVYGLATGQILYHMPKHPLLLQAFIWQFGDTAPHYPRLRAFLKFWHTEIHADISSVEISFAPSASAAEIRHARDKGQMH